MQNLSWLSVVLWATAALLTIRQLLIILAAEQGRKHDLVKKLYKETQELQLSVLIPFLDANDHPALLTLLQAIAEQNYPSSKVTVQLVTTEELADELIPQSLRPNVKVWHYPQPHPRYEHAVAWLIERCLAAGGNGMLVFLKATDIIKPDFLHNVVSRGIDSFAIQGYVALKNPPETPLAKVTALSSRLFNRIGNAGRYHLGLSCRLLDSGWAIKQEVLEMIPYRRGMDLDNLEYSIRLNLENFRVNWAPNVVVYADSRQPFLPYITLCAGALFNRLRLLTSYGPRLLARMLMRFDLNYLEQLISIVKPPYLTAFLVLAALAVVNAQTNMLIGEPVFWAAAAAILLVLEVLSLVVSRCRGGDYATMLFYTPMVYLLGIISAPVALLSYIRDSLSRQAPQGGNYRKMQKTRFNEDLDAPPDLFDEAHSKRVIQGILKKNPYREQVQMAEVESGYETSRLDSAPLTPSRFDPNELVGVEDELPAEYLAIAERRRKKRAMMSEPLLSEMAAAMQPQPVEEVPRARLPKETVRSVPLSNGKKQINCLLKTLTTFDDEGQESYQLVLEYKSVSFSTAAYRILDQAYYELQAKLMARGLTIMTCGSCGNFYNPTADLPGALRNSGVCLFGKQGREVNLNTDAVTVMSQACAYHCALSERETIVRQWKDSLSLSRTR